MRISIWKAFKRRRSATRRVSGFGSNGIVGYHNEYITKAPVIVIGRKGSAGKPTFSSVNAFPIDTAFFVDETSCDVDLKYLYHVFEMVDFEGLSRQMGAPGLNRNDVYNIKIPLPPLEIQQKIVAEIEKIEVEETSYAQRQEIAQEQLTDPAYFSFETRRIGDIANMVKRGKSAKYGSSEIQIIKSGQARGYQNFDFSQRCYVTDTFVSDERNLVKGDILINSTGVGTAGRVTLFDLNGKYVVDSHVTVMRLNQGVALSKYVLYALANIGFKTIEAMANGQSGQIELALDTIKSINIPLPSLDEQLKIVAEIEKIEVEIRTAQAKLTELKLEKDGVLQKYL